MSILKYPSSPQQEPELSEYGEAFLDFLQERDLKNIDLHQIKFACTKIESDFKQARKTRKNGESYESHPYEVARQYIELSTSVPTTNTLIACLLHDHIEDIPQETYTSISNNFNPDIAFLIHLLSKPPIENRKLLSEEELRKNKDTRNITFFENFKSLESLTSYVENEAQKLGYSLSQKPKKGVKRRTFDVAQIIATIKICDRIHNLSTMEKFSPKEIQKKIEETEKYLVPLAQDLCRKDTALLDMLREAIIKATRMLIKKSTEATLSK